MKTTLNLNKKELTEICFFLLLDNEQISIKRNKGQQKAFEIGRKKLIHELAKYIKHVSENN